MIARHQRLHRRTFHPGDCPRSGFTLLEVLLTLAMSVVLMILIGGAIQFYTRNMNVRDMDIRQTQLAAAVMQMIEDDLRACLHGQPADMAGLEALLQASGGGASGGGGDAAAEGEDLSAAGIDSATDETVVADVTTMDLTSGAAVLQSPGLIGNQTQIQVDISRMPRLEEYTLMMDQDATNIDDIPSDLKTVAYFVQPSGSIAGVSDSMSTMIDDPELVAALATENDGGGLIRRSLDRAATTQAASTGAITLLNQTGDLLAPEIRSVEFEYWDGTLWQFQWSSDEFGELPMAVKVVLTMADPTVTAADGSGPDPTAMRTFTHVVRLPLAQPIDTTDDAMAETAL